MRLGGGSRKAASKAEHALQKLEASGQASANAREMWERPPGRGAFLVISLETGFTRVLDTKMDEGVSQVGEEKLSIFRSKILSITGK